MTPSTFTDRELTLAFQKGEVDAYDSIHMRYEVRVSSLCRRMLGNQHDAQEATQETFMRVYQALGRFNGRYQLGAWIVRIATNVCLDHLRARGRTPSDSVDGEILELEPCLTAEGDPESVSMRRAEGRRVRRVLASMPPMHRAALVLRDFEGLSYSEIADALQITDVQVKALIHRARQRFKRHWSTTGLAALLPWRIVQRVRDPEVAARDQFAQVATTWTPTAASCGAALQSCGHYMSERVAAAITVVLVGSVAATGVSASSNGAPEPTRQEQVMTSEDLSATRSGSQVLASHKTSGRPGAVAEEPSTPVASEQTTSATVPPPSEPTPATAPEPEPSVEPDPASSPAPEPSEEPAPSPSAPPPFLPSVTVGAHTSGGARPLSHSYSLSCAERRFSQTLVTQIVVDGEAAPAVMEIVTTGANPYVSLDVQVDGHHYKYRSWGAHPSASWGLATDADASLAISGSYGAEYGSHPEDVGLPRSGAFTAELTLECDHPSVVTERVVFQE